MYVYIHGVNSRSPFVLLMKECVYFKIRKLYMDMQYLSSDVDDDDADDVI